MSHLQDNPIKQRSAHYYVGHSGQLSFWPFWHLGYSVFSLVSLSPFQYSPTTFKKIFFSLIRDSKILLTNQASGFTISSDHLECLLSSISALYSAAMFTFASLPLSVPIPFCPLTWPLAKAPAAAHSLVFLSLSLVFHYALLLLLPEEEYRTLLWSCHSTAQKHLLDPLYSTLL